VQDWRKRLSLKQMYYEAVMCYYMGWQAEEQNKWGERVTYCQGALDKLNDVIKLAKVCFLLYRDVH
jgi:tyrosine-protein phosphatase non-receptor type 23